jgi:hypothetical protein
MDGGSCTYIRIALFYPKGAMFTLTLSLMAIAFLLLSSHITPSALPYLLHVSIYFVNQIPPTDAQCRWDWRYLRCEPFCACLLQFELGDYHLGRSCRFRAEYAVHVNAKDESESDSTPITCDDDAAPIPETKYTKFFASAQEHMRKAKHKVNDAKMELKTSLDQIKLVAEFKACGYDHEDEDEGNDGHHQSKNNLIQRALCHALTPSAQARRSTIAFDDLSPRMSSFMASSAKEGFATVEAADPNSRESAEFHPKKQDDADKNTGHPHGFAPPPQTKPDVIRMDGMGLPVGETPADLMANLSRKRRSVFGREK